MSENSNRRSDEFLKISHQFQLGSLVTESSHPITAQLSEVARNDTSEALRLLFEADQDVLQTFRSFVESGRASEIAGTVTAVIRRGGRMFFTGCGSTGRLSIQLVSIWRGFWQQQTARAFKSALSPHELEQRALSVMAGGDYALIKSVEGFEDYTAFGKRQIEDLGVGERDVVFAITEGGETSFVIGTAWKGLEVGAKVYFVYNNPDEILCRTVQRSRGIIEEQRIEKINLTTGPMSITGSTRMQATTIQLCVLLTILEMVIRQLLVEDPDGRTTTSVDDVPGDFLRYLTAAMASLRSESVRSQLAKLVQLEEATYRRGRKNNYFAGHFAIDVLTDTTERSPTYCTPPFRKFDDCTATDSWAFLFVPAEATTEGWEHIIKRHPVCVEWDEATVRALVGDDKLAGTLATIRKISLAELMRFKVGLDGLAYRSLSQDDIAVGVISEAELSSLLDSQGFHRRQLENAGATGATLGLIYLGGGTSLSGISRFIAEWRPKTTAVLVSLPETNFLLDGVTRVCLKTLLNALSTCAMARLGRVMGNYMIWVVPSNLKLIDRATRYLQQLTALTYREANQLLFEVIEYVEPRMKADQAYPPVVGVAVLRAREKLSNEEAETRLKALA
jgi:N-acetylmuramic acid 6-phosphate etherase